VKYRLEGDVIESIGTEVRVTVNGRTEIVERQCPESIEIATLLATMQGFWPNSAQLQVCGRAADDARRALSPT